MNMQKTIKNRIVLVLVIGFMIFADDAAAQVNGPIAFVSYQDGESNIYLINVDGSDMTQLTNNRSVDTDPAFSRDGKMIAFVSSRHDVSGGLGEIYFMKANGNSQTRVTYEDGSAYSPTWSPDGERIAFIQSYANGYKIIIINADGRGRTAIYSSVNRLTSLDWSPTGTKLVVSKSVGDFNSVLLTINADGTGELVIAAGGFLDNYHHPAWSPDGSLILFGFDGFLKRRLDVIDVNGNNRQTVVDGDSGDPTWSPDGTRIAYTLLAGRNFPLLVVNSDGSRHMKVKNDYPARSPSWGSVRREE